MLPGGVEVGGEGTRALVPLLRHLGEQPEHHLRERAGDLGFGDFGRERRFGEVGVHQLGRVCGDEGGSPGEHLVAGDSEGVEIRPMVDHPVHPSGLLGRQVGERAQRLGGDFRALEHPGDLGGAVEVDQRQAQPLRVKHDVRRVHVAVDDVALVNRGQDLGQLEGPIQKPLDGERPRPEPLRQRLLPCVLEDERGRSWLLLEREGFGDALKVQRQQQPVLESEQRRASASRGTRLNRLDHHRSPVEGSKGTKHPIPATAMEQAKVFVSCEPVELAREPHATKQCVGLAALQVERSRRAASGRSTLSGRGDLVP